MAEHIRVNYEQLEEARKRFGAIADTLEGVTNTINGATEPFRGGQAWRGEAWEAYREEYRASAAAHAALRAAVGEADNKLNAIARMMREAEEEASQTSRSKAQ